MNFDELSKKFRKVGQTAVNEVQKLNEIRQLTSRINDQKKQMSSVFTLIGKKVYEMSKEAPSEEFEAEFEELAEFAAEIERLEQQIRDIKEVRLCPGCGAEVGYTENFCSVCGCKLPEVVKEETAPETEEDEVAEEAAEAAEEVAEAAEEAVEEAAETAEEVVEEAAETVEEVVEEAAEAAEEVAEEVTETAEEAVEEAAEAAEEIAEETAEVIEEVTETVSEAAEEVTETVKEVLEKAPEVVEEAKEAVEEKAQELSETWAQDAVSDIDEYIEAQGHYLRQ